MPAYGPKRTSVRLHPLPSRWLCRRDGCRSRLGARVPVFATASALIAKEIVEEWLIRLLKLQDMECPEWKLLLVQLAKETKAPHLLVSKELRDQVKARFGELIAEDESIQRLHEELIGDALPLGITL